MHKELTAKFKSLNSKTRTIVSIVTVVIVVALAAIIVMMLNKPQRSVTAYCKVYNEQENKLASSQGKTYAVAVFTHRSSNPGDFAKAFTELEKVSPNDIQPDVKTLKQIFQKIDSDPSQALSASMSGIGAESSVKQWTSSHCGAQ